MTVRRALIMVDGAVRELPSSDTLYVAAPPTFEEYESTSTYFYFGGISANGEWIIRRQVRATSAYLTATPQNNASLSLTDLSAAWAVFETLEYN